MPVTAKVGRKGRGKGGPTSPLSFLPPSLARITIVRVCVVGARKNITLFFQFVLLSLYKNIPNLIVQCGMFQVK